MKNRLICLLLCLVMVFSVVLTSCGKKTNEETKEDLQNKASESAVTLTMWVVSEEEVSPTTAKEVNDALNAITKPRFKTQLSVKFFTPDKYRAELERTIAAYEATAPGAAATVATTVAEDSTGVVTDETRVNEHGLIEIVYPNEVENQVDIIYISGQDMFNDYVANEWLAPLDDELAGASKKIKEYVSNTLVSAVKQDGVTYAIPNNNIIGEYTYMLMDKSLMNKYSQQGYIQQGKIDNFCNEYVYTFLDLVAANEPNYIPVDGTYKGCLDMMAHYWSIDPKSYDMLDEFSIFGYYYTDLTELSRGSVVLGYQSLFANKDFAEDFLGLNKCRINNYFGNAQEAGKKAAIQFVKGDATTLKQYEDDYYAVVVEYPTASIEDIYTNMFGVYTRTKNLSRSMEILTYLNTNADFRNTLQYGKEGVHYTLNTDGENVTVEYDRYNRYIMDVYKTGNAFLAYPEPEMSVDIWENGKIQNRYSLIEPLLDFDFASYAATTGDSKNTVAIDSKGYNISVTSGYSKDVLSQNAELKAWLEACDAAGKGYYVYKTSEAVTTSNVQANYYIYNTALGNKAQFNVEQTPIYTEIEDTQGNKISRQTGVDMNFAYTEVAGASPNGYDISEVSIYTRRAYICNVAYTTGGAEDASVSITEKDKLLDFDFFNTKEYSVEVYDKLSLSATRDNKILTDWTGKDCKEDSKKILTYALTFKEELEDKDVYTVVLYRNGLVNITNTEYQVVGNQGELKLIVTYVDDVNKKLDESEPHYVMSYVRITADKGVAVDYAVFAADSTTPVDLVVKESEQDPDFVIWGNLDTELVKTLYNLNNEINELIASCTTYEELESLISDLSILLDAEQTTMFSRFKDEKLRAYISEKAGNGDPQIYLNMVRSYVTAATSKTVKLPDYTDAGEEILYMDKESYIYYASPFAIYYAWLNEYDFNPEEEY